ncbi:hypothetical protein D3C76_1106860 [compost metagenome]
MPSIISPSAIPFILSSKVPNNSLYDNSILPVSLSYFLTTTSILCPNLKTLAALFIAKSDISGSFNIPVTPPPTSTKAA